MIPTPEALLTYLESLGQSLSKRELYDAFQIRGEDKVQFKDLLRILEKKGAIIKEDGRNYRVPDALPTISTVEISFIDDDGDVFATPCDWDEEVQGVPPKIAIIHDDHKKTSVKIGDRVMVRLRKFTKDLYEAKIIKRVDSARARFVAILRQHRNGFMLDPLNRKEKFSFDVSEHDFNGAHVGHIVMAEILPSRAHLNKKARVIEVIGEQNDPKVISLIALNDAGLSLHFPEAVIEQTKDMIVPPINGRDDLRDIPLVTIDGKDARDFDDAVFAEPDTDPQNKGGYHLIVAIADVSYYVRSHTPLDKEAYKRGNSTYFPDRVIPMLPERLSNDLCSLRPHEPRATLAVHMWINDRGSLLKYRFVRGLMMSHARLTYEQVQDAVNGEPDEKITPLLNNVIAPLYDAWKILDRARIERGALDLDVPERKIVINDKNEMTGVAIRARLDSHKVIEEFMILANVAAARALEDRKSPCVYRVHDRPTGDKLMNAVNFLDAFGLSLPKAGIVKPAQLNQILQKAKTLPSGFLINEIILRSQAQAVYAPDNIGHFGLALEKYAHFTSPIRRYADLLVHRSLIRTYNLGDGGMDDEEQVKLAEMSAHISATERVSAEAERNSVDRFTAAYLQDKIGMAFEGRIAGVTRFGLFVKLRDTGADGLIPIRSLPADYYHHDERQHALIGRRTGRVFRLGATIMARVLEANPMSGSMIFELMNGENGADVDGYKTSSNQPIHKQKGKRIHDSNRKFKKKDRKKNSKTR
jgi:ribonuclease R